jgi:glutathione S-transferase
VSGYSQRVPVKLYATTISHPSQAAGKMLELKRVDYRWVDVLPLAQRVHLRLAGFRGGTVPALKVDGRRIQGSRQIARAADQLWPEPPLFPDDPVLRARVEEAERWGEQQLQPVPRRLARYGAVRKLAIRRWGADSTSLPAAALMARTSTPLVRYFARAHEPDGRRADEAGVRADLVALPVLIDHADGLVADGTLAVDPPNAAALQILASVRFLAAFVDLQEFLGGRESTVAARRLFPRYWEPLPAFLPSEWLQPLKAA